MDKTRMKRAQDTCAEALHMPRGKPRKETGRVSLDRHQYRQHARQLAAEKKKTREAVARAEQAEARNETLEKTLAEAKAQVDIWKRNTQEQIHKTISVKTEEKERADQAEKDRDHYKAEYEKLGELNKKIRAEMKATEAAHKEDYQKWKAELNDKETTFQEKETAGKELVAEMYEGSDSYPEIYLEFISFRLRQ